jgi:hypothetical protein
MPQARDWRGRWTSGGGFTAGNSSTVKAVGQKKTARVTKLKKGKPQKAGFIARSNLKVRATKIGSPLNGNPNVRYVSRTNLVARTGIGRAPIRGVGRYVSRRGATAATQPKTGYIVQYRPRG